LRTQTKFMKQLFPAFFFLIFLSLSLQAQNLQISGSVKDSDSGAMLPGVNVSAANAETTTDETGRFNLEVKATGQTIVLTFFKQGYSLFEQTVVPNGEKIDLGVIPMAHPVSNIREIVTDEDRIPIITLSADEEESELDGQNISGILSASQDPFVNAASFNLSTGGFDIRGYSQESIVLFNGMPFNSLESDAVYWSTWGGLNDVTRNRESSIDLSPLSFSFGGIGGAIAFDTRASEQRKQKRVSYMFSNRTYNGRLMGTWSTGMLSSGWAFSFSGSKRWAQEGYVPGTFYDAYSYFASIDRQLGKKHLLNLTALGSPTKRGSQGAAVDEANDLAGTNFYNPNWGYQNGEKRNARVVNTHQPLFVLRHDWQLSENATLMTSAGYLFGRYGRTTLDWFNAPDPRADYYRNMPSFHATESAEIAEQVRQAYFNNPGLLQLQWDKMYQANRENGQQFNGEPGNWSQYILADQRSDTRRFNASSTYQNIISDHLTVNFGVTAAHERIHYFKTVEDLLGGDYYVNLDRFALENVIPGQSPNFNLENSGVIVREGDTYGYDFDINGRKYSSWLQGQFSFSRFDFFVAGDVSTTEFWRTGYFRNGRFPNNSLGDSEKQQYFNYAAKGGLTYKIDGRNYLYANGAYINRAPDARNAYASSRIRDQLVPGLTEETVYAGEAGYQLRSPIVKARATFFYTQINDALKVNRFFLPGDLTRFGTYILTGLDRRHAGVEAAVEAKLTPTLNLRGAASVGEYVYTSRPNGIFIQDDDGVIRDRGKIYIENFYLPSTPQTAGSLGLEYRSPKFWSASVTVNYFDRTYYDISPERRTTDMVFGLEQGSDFYNSIVDQTKAPSAYTVDLFANKSFKINDVFFYLTAGVTNLLNAEVITGGYEQLRFERAQVEQTGINVFPERKFYAYGTNFFILGALRF
jgi:hypothetical protein